MPISIVGCTPCGCPFKKGDKANRTDLPDCSADATRCVPTCKMAAAAVKTYLHFGGKLKVLGKKV